VAMDLPRLVAACDKSYLRDLIAKLAPKCVAKIDWNFPGRELGQAVQHAIIDVPEAWGKLQQIDSLAQHGTTATVRSVLYHDRSLRNEFDELRDSLETAAAWLALKDDALFECALSALHADRGLNKRSWKAFRATLKKDVTFSFKSDRQAEFETLVRHAIRACNAFDAPGELETHYFCRTMFPEFTHSRRVLEQVTVFAEARLVTEDVFVNSRLETKVRGKVDSISIIFDRARQELDVVTVGGSRFISDVANASSGHFRMRHRHLSRLSGERSTSNVYYRSPISLSSIRRALCVRKSTRSASSLQVKCFIRSTQSLAATAY
jgi:hypothetical protein